MRVKRVPDAPLRRVSDACLWCSCQMELHGPLLEGIAVNFGMRPFSQHYMLDHDDMEPERM